jgi:hypothetical protein
MRYPSGQHVRVGDVVRIDEMHSGTVVWCAGAESDSTSVQPSEWDHLQVGVMIDTSFGGLVHYADDRALVSEGVVLAHRRGDA